MKLYRISTHKEVNGQGSALVGGRWNRIGEPVVYTSPSLPEATIESIRDKVNNTTIEKEFISRLVVVTIEIKEKHISTASIPFKFPLIHTIKQTQKLGSDFIKQRKAVALKVPSARFKGHYNILINPYHPEFEPVNISATPFTRWCNLY